MAMIEIADSEKNSPVSLSSISEKQNISLSYLEQIFTNLKKSQTESCHGILQCQVSPWRWIKFSDFAEIINATLETVP